METEICQIAEQSPMVLVLLLLVPFRFENCTVKESWKRVCLWANSIPESILAWLTTYTRVASDLKDLSFLEKSSQRSEAFSVLAFWMLCDLQQATIPGRIDWVQWLLDHMEDKDVEILVQLLLEKCLNLWITPSCSHLCLAVVSRVCLLKDQSKQAEQCFRSLVTVLLNHLELEYAMCALVSLQHHLFAEEKVSLLHYLIPRLDDSSLAESSPLLTYHTGSTSQFSASTTITRSYPVRIGSSAIIGLVSSALRRRCRFELSRGSISTEITNY